MFDIYWHGHQLFFFDLFVWLLFIWVNLIFNNPSIPRLNILCSEHIFHLTYPWVLLGITFRVFSVIFNIFFVRFWCQYDVVNIWQFSFFLYTLEKFNLFYVFI